MFLSCLLSTCRRRRRRRRRRRLHSIGNCAQQNLLLPLLPPGKKERRRGEERRGARETEATTPEKRTHLQGGTGREEGREAGRPQSGKHLAKKGCTIGQSSLNGGTSFSSLILVRTIKWDGQFGSKEFFPPCPVGANWCRCCCFICSFFSSPLFQRACELLVLCLLSRE